MVAYVLYYGILMLSNFLLRQFFIHFLPLFAANWREIPRGLKNNRPATRPMTPLLKLIVRADGDDHGDGLRNSWSGLEAVWRNALKVVKRRNVECPEQMEKGTPDGCSVPCSTGRLPPTLHLQRVHTRCRYDLPRRRLVIFDVTFYYLIYNKKATQKLTPMEISTRPQSTTIRGLFKAQIMSLVSV